MRNFDLIFDMWRGGCAPFLIACFYSLCFGKPLGDKHFDTKDFSMNLFIQNEYLGQKFGKY